MIRIIHDGQKKFVQECDICGCLFEYNISDVNFSTIICPCCGMALRHELPKSDGRISFWHDSPDCNPL